MAEVKFSARAYAKMLLHAAKYPHCAVNGVLLAEDPKSKKGKPLLFLDAIPLFHICLNVSPMAEIALTQIDDMASKNGMVVAGYYQANELLRDTSSEGAAHRIADKIAENFSNPCLVIIENRKLTLNMESSALSVSQYSDGKWKPKEKSLVLLSNDEDCMESVAVLLQRQEYDKLVDFDNHLDDISQDWTNQLLNDMVDEAMTLST